MQPRSLSIKLKQPLGCSDGDLFKQLTHSDKCVIEARLNTMERQVRLALGILIILVMSPWSSMVSPEADETQRLDDERDVEFFSIRTGGG